MSEAEANWRVEACIMYVSGCAVPIVVGHGENISVCGTGALFRVDTITCLLTARHVIDALTSTTRSTTRLFPCRTV